MIPEPARGRARRAGRRTRRAARDVDSWTSRNVDVRTVAGRLGHSSPSITLNVYSHFIENADREAARRMGELMSHAFNASPTTGPGPSSLSSPTTYHPGPFKTSGCGR